LDEPAIHADLLLGVSLLLFEKKGSSRKVRERI
jgi:hypothetical protein